jgi:hypothetical protein
MKPRLFVAGLIGAALLAACGGGDDGGGGPASCSVAAQKTWLRSYMADWYFWYKVSPSPDPAGYPTVAEYFDALLYQGGLDPFPADRWSYVDTTESFDRFYVDGQTLGYGVFVAGFEVAGQPDQPLLVRYIEPKSPAALAGVARGDRIMAINGRPASDIIAADDFSVLTPSNPGETITLNLGDGREVTLTAAVFDLTPVSTTAVVTSPGGRKLGYVLVKDMISQADGPLATAFQGFKAQGVNDVVIDLRYNGGGLVSTAGLVASGVAAGHSGRTFASLLYNDRHASSNETFVFKDLANALAMSRVYVLTGSRTCSASEQVINGLRGVGIDVIAIGDTTCGKPVGFLPNDDGCGTTYSAVNFESVNARLEGRYFDGFAPTCPVADDLAHPLGSPAEGLLAAAGTLADGGACPVASTREQAKAWRPPGVRKREPGERQDMIPR